MLTSASALPLWLPGGSGSRSGRVVLTAASVYLSAWGLYYLASETIRAHVLRRRRRRYALPPAPAGEASDPGTAPGTATAEEAEAIRKRFGSLRVLGRWANVVPEWREQGAWEWAVWKGVYSLLYRRPRIWWDGGFSRDLKTTAGRERIERLVPVHKVDHAALWTQPAQHPLTFTWIGQSTCLIQLHGLTILTDPVFGDQPLESLLSPTRLRPIPCSFDELLQHGRIDVVLLTHNHFDHLDVSILPRVPRATKWFVPLGLTPLLVQHGLHPSQITELDWWQEHRLETDIAHTTIQVTAVPAAHWSARTPLDTNRTLWNSYAVRVSTSAPHSKPVSLFFCGDTGYSPSLFRAIGASLGPFDIAALPIGSYAPEWHMRTQHMHVRDAVQVARDIGAKQSYGMHWATWVMSDEEWHDPADQLARLHVSNFDTVPFGKTMYPCLTRLD